MKKASNPEIQKKFDEGYKLLIEESLRLRQKSDFADLTIASTQRVMRIVPIVYFGGLFLTAAGFLLWYFRLQRFQDQIVQKEASKPSKNDAKA